MLTRLLTAPVVSARGALGLGHRRPEVLRPDTEPEGATHDVPRQGDLCPRRRPRSRRAGLITAGALAASMAVAACGGPPTPRAATGSTAASTKTARHGASQASGLAAYTNCIRTHGVPNFSPHPTTSVGAPKKDRQQEQQSLQQLKVSKSRLLAAQKACEQLLSAGPSSRPPDVRQAMLGVLDEEFAPLHAYSEAERHQFTVERDRIQDQRRAGL